MPLTGAQKTKLRGLGQRLEPSVKIGQAGLAGAVLTELSRALAAEELIKVRFVGFERDDRAKLCEELAKKTSSENVGAVGHTALFYKVSPEGKIPLD